MSLDDRSVISLTHQGDNDALVFDRRRSRLFPTADAGSKARKATEPGVRTITEAEWRDSDNNFVGVSEITPVRRPMPDNAGNEFLGSQS